MKFIKRWWCKHFHGTTIIAHEDGRADYSCMHCRRKWVEWHGTKRKKYD